MINDKSIILTLLGFLFFTGLLGFLVKSTTHQYLVELSFCDNRAPIKVIITDHSYPRNRCINNYENAVPEYKGYLNVCNINVIKQIENGK